MTCRDFESALASSLNGGSPGEVPEGAAAHLRSCDACRQRAPQVLDLHEVLVRTLRPADPGAVSRIQDVVADVEQNRRKGSTRRRVEVQNRIRQVERRARNRRWWAALASAAAFAAAMLVLVRRSPPSLLEVPDFPSIVIEQPSALPPAPEKAAVVAFEPTPPAVPTPPPVPVEKPAPVAEKPEETPAPVVPTKSPAPRSATVAAVASVRDAQGEVYVVLPSEDRRVQPGQGLEAGQTVKTKGPRSRATVVYPDGSQVDLGAETVVRDITEPGQGKGLFLAQGSVSAQIQKPMVFLTTLGKAAASDSTFALRADAERTRLEVQQGRVALTRLLDGSVSVVEAGNVALLAQDPKTALPDQSKIDQAIAKGLAFLKAGESPGINAGGSIYPNCDELILLTFLHGGVPPTDPKFQELFKRMLETKLERTYKVALQAMVLEEFHRVKYQQRILECAQFLVDNQCKNGQWSYGKETPAVAPPEPVPTEVIRKAVATAGKEGAKGTTAAAAEPKKPKVTRFVSVKKTRDGIPAGDNSNTQYGALGLRACHDSGIVFPQEVIYAARGWWVESVISTPLPAGNAGPGAVATGKDAPVGPNAIWGWCYKGHHLNLVGCKNPDRPYTSMTAGGTGSLVIYDYMLKQDWKKDRNVANGMAWMAEHFTATQHYGPPELFPWRAYNLYAIERLGMLYGTEMMGTHPWYAEGAQHLLSVQKDDGSWSMSTEYTFPTYDTCFAILFLKRATRSLTPVASTDRAVRKPAPEEKPDK